jgi:hypothetical protein
VRRRQQRALVVQDIEQLQHELDALFDLADKFGQSLALEGEARQRIGELHRELRTRLQPAALRVEQLRDHYSPKGSSLEGDVVLRGTTAVVFMAMEVVALDVATEAMLRATISTDEDELFIRSVVDRCSDAIESHASMVRSVLRGTPGSVLVMGELYKSDPDGAFAAFNEMVQEFNEFKERMG